jgi:hypothetical protein
MAAGASAGAAAGQGPVGVAAADPAPAEVAADLAGADALVVQATSHTSVAETVAGQEAVSEAGQHDCGPAEEAATAMEVDAAGPATVVLPHESREGPLAATAPGDRAARNARQAFDISMGASLGSVTSGPHFLAVAQELQSDAGAMGLQQTPTDALVPAAGVAAAGGAAAAAEPPKQPDCSRRPGVVVSGIGPVAVDAGLRRSVLCSMIAEARTFVAEWRELRAVQQSRLAGRVLQAPLEQVRWLGILWQEPPFLLLCFLFIYPLAAVNVNVLVCPGSRNIWGCEPPTLS